MAREYNDPAGGDQSTIGNQLRTDYFYKEALIEARKEQYFSQLADVRSMPKNMGKKIKQFHYIPLLDDRNINDQGIDAAGVAITNTVYYVNMPSLVVNVTNATKAAKAVTLADNLDGVTATAGADDSGGTGFATITLTKKNFKVLNITKANAITALLLGATVQQGSGNLYGSSKDVGTISGKLPVLSENGGRVNRVGFKRVELEGSFEKFGFFDEYTQASLDFDSDADLDRHVSREMINGANEITEDALQIDLLNAAGVIRYAGNATSKATIDSTDVVSYSDLMHLSIDLDNNRTPKHTTVITGTRLVDTRVVPSARILYIGSELLPTLKAMVDLHGNPAFIEVQKYQAAGSVVTGEAGALDQFRVVVVPEMMKWAGAGADSSGDATNYETNGRYDVFPMLCIGDQSYTTIGFQTDGKTVKFKIFNKKPGDETADRNDPYGETGFMSIKWFYGFMILRSERIGLVLTSAKL
jgi:N4-gp56 family major capsid protein